MRTFAPGRTWSPRPRAAAERWCNGDGLYLAAYDRMRRMTGALFFAPRGTRGGYRLRGKE